MYSRREGACAPGASDVICEQYFIFDNDQPAQANCKLSKFVSSQFPAHAHAGVIPDPTGPGQAGYDGTVALSREST